MEKTLERCAQAAGLRYCWHDGPHTFFTRLAENPAVSEETISALAGYVSRKMLKRYSHIRLAAKQAAIHSLEAAVFDAKSPQNPPRFVNSIVGQVLRYLREGVELI